MNPFKDTIQSQLANFLRSRIAVYGLGSNGLSIADYLVISKQISEEFSPKAFVFVLVDNDLSEAIVLRKGWHVFHHSDSNWPIYIPEREGKRAWYNDVMADSSLYRYLKGNLGLTPNSIFGPFSSSPEKSTAAQPAEQRNNQIIAIKAFIENLPVITGRPNHCHIFLMDADRYSIYDPNMSTLPIDPPELRSLFLEEARRHNLTVVDLKPLFIADYNQFKEKFDFFPVDRHWNSRGHFIAAQAAYKALSSSALSCIDSPSADDSSTKRSLWPSK